MASQENAIGVHQGTLNGTTLQSLSRLSPLTRQVATSGRSHRIVAAPLHPFGNSTLGKTARTAKAKLLAWRARLDMTRIVQRRSLDASHAQGRSGTSWPRHDLRHWMRRQLCHMWRCVVKKVARPSPVPRSRFCLSTPYEDSLWIANVVWPVSLRTTMYRMADFGCSQVLGRRCAYSSCG